MLPSEISSFWLLSGSFLKGLRSFRQSSTLWKPCGNRFVQKSTLHVSFLEMALPRESYFRKVLNMRALHLRRAFRRDLFAHHMLPRRFSTFAQVCSRVSTDEYSIPRDATHSAC